MAYTDEQKQTLLDTLASTGSEAIARKAIGASYAAVSQWRKNDEAFAEAFDDAKRDAFSVLENEARRRALGYEVKVFNKDGELSGTKYVASDPLMQTLLKAGDPDGNYVDRSRSEIVGAIGTADMTETKAAARIAAILDEAARRKAGEIDPLS
jgi:hypothetical protein